jgi:protein-arginine kinase activator protein McsA
MAGIGESELEQSEAEMEEPKPKESKPRKRDKSLATLQSELTKAIAREDYEQASKIRDEIEQRQEKE